MGNSRNEPRAAAETQMSPLLSSICFVPGDRQKFPQRNLLFSRREKAPNGEWKRGRGHFVEQTCDGGENCRALGNGERDRAFLEGGGLGRSQDTAHEAASKSCIVIRSCNHASDTLSHALLATSALFDNRYRKPNVLDGMLAKNIQIVVLYRHIFLVATSIGI